MANRRATKEEIDDRRHQMYDYISSRKRGEKMTLDGVAQALGRKKNESFSRDMAALRQWAYGDGHCITLCVPDEDEGHVFYFLREGQEDGLSEGGLRMASINALTRVRNLGKYGTYVSKNAQNPETRLYGQLNMNWAAFSQSAMDSIDDYWAHKARLSKQE